MNDYCEDLCKEKFLNALLNMNDLDDSCLTLSTSSIISLSSLLSRKFLYHSLDQDKCFILKDDADRSLKILPKSNERPEDLECLYVDNLKDLERKCWPVNNFLNEESLRYILNFFKIRIIDKDGLFNPAQESILTTIDYIDNIVPIQIPPLSFISIEEIEKRTLAHRSMLSSAEAKRINVLSKDTLIIKDSRDLKIKLIGDFYNIRCFVNNEVEICLGDELLLYTDTPNRLVLKGSGYKEITLKINMRSSLVSWSHPLGPATDFYERNINKDFRGWWLDLFNLSDSVHISLASYPYLDVNLKNHNEIIASLPNGSMVISTGSSLEETIPWILSHKLVDPVKTRYVTSSRRPLLNIIPNKIVLHSVYFDPVKKNVYMYLINYLPKDFGVSLISSGYFKNVAVSYLKNIWESLFPSFNMLRLSLPAYSIASLRFFDEE